MKKIILVCSALLCHFILVAQGKYIQGKIDGIPQEGFAIKNLFNPISVSSENYDFTKDLSQYTLATVSADVLNEVVNTYEYALEVDIPFEGSFLTLQLMKSNFVTENSVFTAQNNHGKENFKYPLGAYYFGVVKNMPGTCVGISFFANDIIGMIAMPEGNIVIGKSNVKNALSEEYIIYNDKYLKIENTSRCGADDDRLKTLIPKYDTKKAVRTITTNCVKFYVECDYKTYQDFGNSVVSTTNFATGLFNLVSTLYLNDSVSTAVQQVNVWTVTDPYAADMNTYDALVSFSTQMQGGFNGDLAHLLSKRSLGGGIAWLDVLCDAAYYRSAVSASLSANLTPLPTYSWNTMVVTHEAGHNMASPHTHACAWNGNNTRIDNCAGNYDIQYQEGNCNSFPPNPVGGGTIMSYCHLQNVGINLSLGFGPQPGALIRSRVNSGPCLSECVNCNGGITITGVFSDTLTESNTWIKSSGQTTISGTAKVKLDPNPYAGYALFLPANNNDFFVASPSNTTAFFVSQAYDGCSGNAPQLPNNKYNENEPEMQPITSNAFSLYPNPTRGNLMIENGSLVDANVRVEIYSVEGKLLLSKSDILFNGSHQLDVKNLSSGLYFIKLENRGEVYTLKFEKY
jgi:hypothetical protein